MAWPVRYRSERSAAGRSRMSCCGAVSASALPARAPALCTLLGVPMIVVAALVLYFLVVPEPIERPERVAELAGQGAQG